MIPLVDLSDGDCAQSLASALEASGFVELTGHGLGDELSAALRAAADQFFSLPPEVKGRFVHPDPLANRGFRARGSEALAYSLGESSPPDLFESFNTGSDSPAAWTALA